MLLRMLVSNYVRQAAQQKILEAVAEASRAAGDDAGESDADRPSCGVAVICGLGVESGGLVDLLEHGRARRLRTHTERLGMLDGRVVLIAESGAGAELAARATLDIISRHRPAWVINAGFASSLEEQTTRGKMVLASSVVNQQRGEELATDLSIDPRSAGPALRIGRLVSTDRELRTPQERRELGKQFDARAADMESFAVARVCRELGPRFLAIKIVTDPVDHQMPREMEILLQQKSVAGMIGAAAGALLSWPSSVTQMWQLKEEALIASDRLAKFLRGMIVQLPLPRASDES